MSRDPATLTPQELAEACRDAMLVEDHAARRLGAVVESVGPGTSRVRLEPGADLANGHGMIHGGYVYTLADTAFAYACNTYNRIVVAQHCSITYVAPAQVGVTLYAEGREAVRFGRNGIYDIRVSDADGRLIAEFRGHSREIPGSHLPDGNTEEAAR